MRKRSTALCAAQWLNNYTEHRTLTTNCHQSALEGRGGDAEHMKAGACMNRAKLAGQCASRQDAMLQGRAHNLAHCASREGAPVANATTFWRSHGSAVRASSSDPRATSRSSRVPSISPTRWHIRLHSGLWPECGCTQRHDLLLAGAHKEGVSPRDAHALAAASLHAQICMLIKDIEKQRVTKQQRRQHNS